MPYSGRIRRRGAPVESIANPYGEPFARPTQIQNPGGSYQDVEIYRKLYSDGKIKLRIYKVLSAPGKQADRLLAEGPIIGAYNNHLTVRALKCYADGSLGSRSAALLAPYSDAPNTSGFLTVKEADLLPMLEEGSLPARWLGSIDVFGLWWVWLLAVGLAAGTGRPARRYLPRLLVAYVGVAALVAAVFAVFGAQ